MTNEEMLAASFDALEQAILRLEEAIAQEADDKRFIIDATIQRFEFTFELCWKTFKRFLEREGVITKTPRQAIQEAYRIGWIDEEQQWLQMINDRNLTSHVYNTDTADEIYNRIPEHARAIRHGFNHIPSQH